ncbi:MAG TPA: hypothetical protein VNH46_01135, partial [Gemmatimonadales bacterium]|nr:hypothetical protein [Gemmatimonadales bacterium]
GNTSGQFGSFASIIAVIRNQRGAVVVRRSELRQDTFAKYARFFNTWGSGSWGPNVVVFGPVHSNQGIALTNAAPGVTFWGPVTAVGAITNQARGNWRGGVTTGVAAIPYPTTQSLTNLQSFATAGQTVVAGYANTTANDPDVRIEFVAIDLNGDGDVLDDGEGFFRIYRAKSGGTATLQQQRRNVVTARFFTTGVTYPGGTSALSDPNLFSPNCGGSSGLAGGAWLTADSIMKISTATTTQRVADVQAALTSSTRHCYLGGDAHLYGTTGNPGLPQYVTGDAWGDYDVWPGWGGAPPANLVTAIGTAGVSGAVPTSGNATAVASTFWPLSRIQNPNFKGIIYVTGSVAVSGTLSGRVTVVAQGNIILPDDITYAQPPNTNCADMLGLLTTNDAWLEDNNVNGIFKVANSWTVAFDDTPNETFDAFILTLGNLFGENLVGGESVIAPENCGGTSRGCKSVVGGTMEQSMTTTFSGNTGWAEQDTYDNCGKTAPPPYFPSTGRYVRNRYYEIDPVGFTVAGWFAANQ